MNKLLLIFLFIPYLLNAQIVADHSIVDRYDDIPQFYIDSVKKMWASYSGESHSQAILRGLDLLEALDATYAVDTHTYLEAGNPDGYTDANLRVSPAMWGDRSNATGWIYETGEEDWWTNATGIAQVKTGLSYCFNSGPQLAALGFGWCWDATREGVSAGTDPMWGNRWYGKSIGGASGDLPWGITDADNDSSGNVVNMDDYLAAIQGYIDYCTANNIPTKVFYTTGPVDNWEGAIPNESLFQGHLKYEHIRNYVRQSSSRILFDYADILCFNNDNELDTIVWDGHVIPTIHIDNDYLHSPMTGHIGDVGALRLAKAFWWMLARIAGWDGTTTYYVATDGNDADPGTISEPFANWQQGFDIAGPGDTVLIRGGIYYTTELTHPRVDPFGYVPHGTSGTREMPIHIFNYPGETPVLDCSANIPSGGATIVHGLELKTVQFLHFKGLTIRNLYQRDSAYMPQGITFEQCANITFENMTVHDISGRGVFGSEVVGYEDAANTPNIIYADSTRFINCDFYNLCDSTSANPGNAADGVKLHMNGRMSKLYPVPYLEFFGCRVWNYSDDGIDISGEGVRKVERSIASSTDKYTYTDIEGNGFKLGGVGHQTIPSDSLLDINWVIVRNSIAVNCEGSGFYDLDYVPYHRTNGLYYNNIAFNNYIGFYGIDGYLNNWYLTHPRTSIYRNNIAYSNSEYEVALYRSPYPESHNNWDFTGIGTWPGWEYTDTVTVANDDFVSLSTAQLFAPRKADGSLPDITFGRLAEGSDLIGAGTNVGMSSLPDMGIDWLYLDNGAEPPEPPVPGNRTFAISKSGKFTISKRGLKLKY